MRNLMFLALGLCLGVYISRLKSAQIDALRAAQQASKSPLD